MSKSKNESARHLYYRIARLDRRLRQLVNKSHISDSQRAELSALEWAIPILEKYVTETTGKNLSLRADYYKHEKQEIIDSLLERDGDECYLCEKIIPKGEMTIDHIVPLHKRGKDDMSNYKLVHNDCNVLKGNFSLEEFRKRFKFAKESL